MLLTLGGALKSWTEPAQASMSWTEPAEASVSTSEEPALDGAGEEQHWRALARCRHWRGTGEVQALEGTGEVQALEGTGEVQALEGAVSEQALEGAGRGAGTGGHWRGAGTGGHWRGAGTGGRSLGAVTGGRWRGGRHWRTLDSAAFSGALGKRQSLGGAREARTLWGAGEARSLGGRRKRELSGAPRESANLSGALGKRDLSGGAGKALNWSVSWAGPAETPVGWFRLGTGNFPDTGNTLSPTQSRGVWEIHGMMVRAPSRNRWMAASCISVPAASPQNSQANSTKGRSRRLRARTLAANSITSEEEDELLGPVFCHGCAGEPGTRIHGTSFKLTLFGNIEQRSLDRYTLRNDVNTGQRHWEH